MAVMALYGATLLLSGFALVALYSRSTDALVVLASVGIMFILGNHFLRIVDVGEVRRRITRDHEWHAWNKKTALAVARAGQHIARARDHRSAWSAATEAFAAMGVREARIKPVSAASRVSGFQWGADRPGDNGRESDGAGRAISSGWDIQLPVLNDAGAPDLVLQVRGQAPLDLLKHSINHLQAVHASLQAAHTAIQQAGVRPSRRPLAAERAR